MNIETGSKLIRSMDVKYFEWKVPSKNAYNTV